MRQRDTQEGILGHVLPFGPAHSAAVAKIGDISRGGGAVTHFADDGSGATFANAASKLAGVPAEF